MTGAESRAVLAFQTPGRIADTALAVGDVVRAGQVLATQDQISLQEDVDAAQAAQAAQAANQASAEAAAQNLARVKELAARAVATSLALDAAQSTNDTAAAAAEAKAAAADRKRAKDAAGFAALTAPAEGVVLSIAVKAGTVVAAGTQVLTLALGPGRKAVLDIPADFLPVLTTGRAFALPGRLPATGPLTATLRQDPSRWPPKAPAAAASASA